MASPTTQNTPESGTAEDFILIDERIAFGYTYLVLSIITLCVNILIIFLIFRSERMVQTPKYWLVLCICLTLCFQATVSNTQMIAKWLYLIKESKSCKMWELAVIFNTYVCVGVVSWNGFLIHLDFFMCNIASYFIRVQRAKIVVILFLCCILTLVLFTVLTTQTASTWTDSQQVESNVTSSIKCGVPVISFPLRVFFIWIIFTVPVLCSVIVCFLTVLCKYNNNFQGCFKDSTERSVMSSISIEMEPGLLPPADHILFLALVILMYLPGNVVEYFEAYGNLSLKDTDTTWVHLITTSLCLRDNAGCLLSTAWFLFSDMRVSLRKVSCIKQKDSPIDSALAETSEFRLYDVYPYCDSMQLL